MSLATIKVTGPRGEPVAVDSPVPAPGDPRSLSVRVPALAKGVYTVDWRVVSRVDGHPTGGAFSFGVGVTPEQSQLAAAARDNGAPSASAVEVVGRFVFLLGVIALLGAACAGAAGYAGAGRGLRLAALAWLVAVVGLAMLTYAQRGARPFRSETSSTRTPVRAFEGRALALVIVGVALLAARFARTPIGRALVLATGGHGRGRHDRHPRLGGACRDVVRLDAVGRRPRGSGRTSPRPGCGSVASPRCCSASAARRHRTRHARCAGSPASRRSRWRSSSRPASGAALPSSTRGTSSSPPVTAGRSWSRWRSSSRSRSSRCATGCAACPPRRRRSVRCDGCPWAS